jgi:uncharacterized membrane protein YfcA
MRKQRKSDSYIWLIFAAGYLIGIACLLAGIVALIKHNSSGLLFFPVAVIVLVAVMLAHTKNKARNWK